MVSRNRSQNRKDRKTSKAQNHTRLISEAMDCVQRGNHKKPVEIRILPQNENQERYDSFIHSRRIIFGVGPAGTGKTWYAAMMAAKALKEGKIERIIVTRPAVEAGENMGFLPGEIDEKYEPYFRPVKDALEEFFGTGALEYHLKAKTIEARPLAFLRGSTIKNAWVIADEMQNSTKTQMKMLLSRIGENGKMIINGDPKQTDLPGHIESGLMDAVRRFEKHHQMGVVHFTHSDIVRDGIVQDIVSAYEIA
jgi:phosphate starvation-inducible PhoH-like protein